MRNAGWIWAVFAIVGCVAPQGVGRSGHADDDVHGGPPVASSDDHTIDHGAGDGGSIDDRVTDDGSSDDGSSDDGSSDGSDDQGDVPGSDGASGDGSSGIDDRDRVIFPGGSASNDGADQGTIPSGGGSGSNGADQGTIPSDGACEPARTPLYAGRTIESGSVTVATRGDELVVKVITIGDWLLEGLHVYAGSGPIPTNPGGNVAPGSFPYARTFSPQVTSAELRIPLGDLGAACGDPLEVAVHANVVRPVDQTIQSETAWAYGTAFGGRQWGWSLGTTVCCEEVYGCTYTQGFWKTHPYVWPVTRLTLGGIEYSQAELLALFATPPRGDASLILAHQLIAAELNGATRATMSSEARDALDVAHAWLATYGASGIPCGTSATSPEGAIAVALAETLAAHNEGRLGTPHCDGDVVVPQQPR